MFDVVILMGPVWHWGNLDDEERAVYFAFSCFVACVLTAFVCLLFLVLA